MNKRNPREKIRKSVKGACDKLTMKINEFTKRHQNTLDSGLAFYSQTHTLYYWSLCEIK